MDDTQRRRLAETRAESYAPRPTGGAVMAGVCGAAVLLLTDVMVSRFYGWQVLDHLWVTSVAMLAGFLVGTLGYLRLAHRHRKARRAERVQIDAEQDG